MKKIADGINNAMKEGENRQKILNIQNSFIGSGGFEVCEGCFFFLFVCVVRTEPTKNQTTKQFIVPHRNYVRDGALMKVCRKAVKERWFFLFNDFLLYASVSTSSARM